MSPEPILEIDTCFLTARLVPVYLGLPADLPSILVDLFSSSPFHLCSRLPSEDTPDIMAALVRTADPASVLEPSQSGCASSRNVQGES